MKLTLRKKSTSTDKDPLVIMVEHPKDMQREDATKPGQYPKIVFKATVGKAFDVNELAPEGTKFSDDDATVLGHAIMSRYPGLFVLGDAIAGASAAASADEKSKKGYQDKSAAAVEAKA